jgi:hypothetical protein
MAPVIPTHRPLLTATRMALAVAVMACASSVYLATSSGKAQAAEAAMIPAGACPAAAAHAPV